MLDVNVTVIGLLVFMLPLVVGASLLFWDLYKSLESKTEITRLKVLCEVAKSEKRVCDIVTNCFGQLQREVEDLKRNRKENKND